MQPFGQRVAAKFTLHPVQTASANYLDLTSAKNAAVALCWADFGPALGGEDQGFSREATNKVGPKAVALVDVGAMWR